MSGQIWTIADTHFSHKNIIDYENRPYKDIDHMNESIIENWNSVVGKRDKVFLLGDVGMGKPEDYATKIARLRGDITLVLGNHDHSSVARWMEAGMAEVSRYPILYKGFYLLSHKPIYMNEHTPFVNIYGHVHSHPSYNTWASTGVCVSIERHNYTPINFDTIEEYFKRNRG